MIVAALCWYDEAPDLLGAAILSAADAGVEALVALDGAYATYPDGHAASPDEQLAAIVKTTRATGLSLTVSQPARPWATEADKRTRLFRLADAMCAEGDWIFVMDADYQLRVKRPLPALLADVDERVAELALWTPPNPGRVVWRVAEWTKIRCLFRDRGIVVGPDNHYTYSAPDGALLWGYEGNIPAADLAEEARIDHLSFHRSEARVETQMAYYMERDASGIERGPCQRCRRFRSICWMPTNITGDREYDEFDWLEVCAVCIPDVAAENTATAIPLGLDVASLTKPIHLVRGSLDAPPVPA